LTLNDNKPYLLQVWTQKGDMVFEKALHKPVCNWNITKDKFLFQEEPNRPEVFLVDLRLNRAPKIFQFNIPKHISRGRVNSFWDDATKKITVPAEEANSNKIDESAASKEFEFAENINVSFKEEQAPPRPVNSSRKVYSEPSGPSPSVSQLFGEELI